MPGSQIPGPIDNARQYVQVQDGTSALIAMPGAGTVGTSTHNGLPPAARPQAAVAQLQALSIDAQGHLADARVVRAIAPTIERGPMAAVRGIVVHQTGGATAQSSLSSYKAKGANGAHFLIDKDGTVYQTASLTQRTWHVGKLRARCLAEQTCTPVELKAYARFDPTGMHKSESAKAPPARYPSNEDSIGIELVGQALPPAGGGAGEAVYEDVTDQQNSALKWLVADLTKLLGVPMTEIFRHPQVSRKNASEARSAKWQ